MGDIANDGTNQYLYDSEGRVCAVISTPVPGFTTKTGYLYDAAGNRIAKGTITTMSCDPAQSGFQLTETYVVGPGGEEMTMFDGSGHWQRTNVYGAGRQLATYDQNANGTLVTTPVANAALHFQLIDSLGTPGSPTTGLRRWGGRRMQTTATGQPETDIQSLPFGNGLNPYPDLAAPGTADDATPLHFTGKERDPETGEANGNDYFGARYYQSAMGRFLSPDWSAKIEPVPYSKLDDPQSFNLYEYVGNNPLNHADSDGHGSGPGDQSGIDTEKFANLLQVQSNLGIMSSKDVQAILAQQQTNLNSDLKTQAVQRVTQGLAGAANLLDVPLRAAALVPAVAALAENPPAAGTAAVYGVVSIFGQTVSGAAQIGEAVTGNSSGTAHNIEQVGNMLSGPEAGLTTMMRTQNLNKAAAAGNAESVFTAGTGLVDKATPLIQRVVEFGMSLLGIQ